MAVSAAKQVIKKGKQTISYSVMAIADRF